MRRKCRERDSNSYRVAPTTTSTLRVYHFATPASICYYTDCGADLSRGSTDFCTPVLRDCKRPHSPSLFSRANIPYNQSQENDPHSKANGNFAISREKAKPATESIRRTQASASEPSPGARLHITAADIGHSKGADVLWNLHASSVPISASSASVSIQSTAAAFAFTCAGEVAPAMTEAIDG